MASAPLSGRRHIPAHLRGDAGDPVQHLEIRSRANDGIPGQANAYVLDDGADATARHMAAQLEFEYIVRSNRGWYRKSGNLRNAFEQTNGEFFLILDADFTPRSDLLAELLPYFDDPHVGIVQSPQYFRTTPEQTWVERAGSAIQEVFYRSIQISGTATGRPSAWERARSTGGPRSNRSAGPI